MAKAFCPNCGTENEGTPGMRVTCIACTASFEVPREVTGFGATQPTPSAPPVAAPPLSRPTVPPGYTGPAPGGGYMTGGGGNGPGGTNTLAIVSLVLGILCCLPFSIGAIITGVIAQNQIKQTGEKGRELAIAGIVLGVLALLVNFFSIFASLIAPR